MRILASIACIALSGCLSHRSESVVLRVVGADGSDVARPIPAIATHTGGTVEVSVRECGGRLVRFVLPKEIVDGSE